MYSRFVLISAVHFIVIIVFISSQCDCQAAGDGITISLGDRVIPNHGLVTTEDIGVDPTGANLMEGLKCSTNYSGCCNDLTRLTREAIDAIDPSGVGSWEYAHTTNYVSRQIDAPQHIAGITRNGQAVYVFRNRASDNNRLYLLDGIWRCVIPDSNGTNQTKYIGIYSNPMSNNGTLSAGSPGTIQFTMVSEDPVMFNLTFRTTGGPATYVTWTRDGVNISSSGDNCFTPSQTVLTNGGIYTAGDYDNTLTVSGRLSGVYGVSVTNDRTTTLVTATRNVLGDGITISLGDGVIPNHGLVTLEDIGLDDTGEDLTVGLKCSTTYADCCTSSTTDARWYFANVDIVVPTSQPGGPNSFETNRSGQAVYLFRNMESTTNGIMRCEIPDSNGHLETKYVGVYNSGRTGALSAHSPHTIEVSTGSTSEDPMMFTLTFRTTGGPATYVTWTRNGADICLGDSRYTPSQTVQPDTGNTEVYTLGHYDNILTVSGRLSGVYGVSVTNDRTRPDSVTASITVLDYPQDVLTSGSATQSPTDGDITISWTVSNSSVVSRFFDGYEIQYRISCTSNQQSSCGGEPVTVMVDTTATDYDLTSVTPWVTYEFSIALINKSNHHYFPGISGLHREGIQIMMRDILSPEITSVSELANITSVQVTWNQPEGGLAADEYVVSYRRLNGRDEQCSSFQDEDSVTVSAEGSVTNTLTLHLQAYSVYAVNVASRNEALNSASSTVQVETNSTVPSGAPLNLTIMDSNSTSVTISWDSVECIHRNGLITHYLLAYDSKNDVKDSRAKMIGLDNHPRDSYTYTATGLNPSSSYLFKVAAINNVGIGPFATVETREGATSTCTTTSTAAATVAMATVIVILLIIVAVLCGIILAIWVFKNRTQGHGNHLAKDKQLPGMAEDDDITETQSKPHEAVYDEINLSSEPPKTSIEMETCPAYDVTKTQ